MLQYLLGAFALMLIFESILPLISPEKWREMLKKFVEIDNQTIRKFAFLIFISGSVIWILIQHAG